MNTETALAQLGISIADLTKDQQRKLDEDGYFVAEAVLSPADVVETRSEFDRVRAIEGDFGGHARTSRGQKFLLDIDGGTPKVIGYPPLPDAARAWASIETVAGDRH